jgi:predicted NBD/HSP70 family sugar kinase/biotin operon repressor
MGRPDSSNSLSRLRERNRVHVLDALRGHGRTSRAELARITGLSRTTVSGLVNDLIDRGLVVEHGAASGSQPGRPGVLLSLDPRAGTALAFDFGHSHLRVAIADLASNILAEEELKLDVDHSAHEALDSAADLAEKVLESAGVEWEGVIGAAMGLPGPIDDETGVVGSSVILPAWAGLRPVEEIQRRIGLRVTVDNDANLAVLGEARFGAARGARDVIYVKVSSGIGAGMMFGGRLHRGISGSAGEFGHVLVDPDGSICRCGNRGCLETVASAGTVLDLLRPSYGDDLAIADVLARASAGEIGPRRALLDAGRAVGQALANLCNVTNPERIVIGGELGGPETPLLEGVEDSLARYALPGSLAALAVVGGALGGRAEVLGALSLVIGDTEGLSSEKLAAGRS